MTEIRHVGLTVDEAKRRLQEVGPNEISSSRLNSKLAVLRDLFLDPMGLMLLGLAGLYAVLGDYLDSIVLLIAWIPVTAVDVILNLRTSGALKALKAQLSPIAKVLRDGTVHDVFIREIVPGDLLVFEEGQTLPADGRIVEAENLSVNESALTGESLPVDKLVNGEFFSGTQILSGRGLGVIVETAKNTSYGKIAGMLEGVEASASPLKKKVDRLVKIVLIVAAVLSAILFALEIFRSGNIIPSLIVALTFGMSAIPEEFPLVFTLYLSLGAWRLSKHRVLVKSLPSVEALGSADILCTDKTGTLTEGKFSLETIRCIVGEPNSSVWEAAIMACEPIPVDSMETAIYERGKSHVQALRDWSLVWDYPFEKQGKHMTHVWRHNGTEVYRTIMKGAVEGVLEHCEVSKSELTEIEKFVKEYAAQGKRLLGLAMREGSGSGIRATDERALQFLGVLVFADPIRPSVAGAIAECQAAGIEIKLLTGDHPFTAHYIANQAGIVHSHDFLFTGDELSKMDLEHRRNAYLKGAIFSRVLPEQKHELVRALQAEGRVVAMIGDGINDAPALKLADIGISMGVSATDVARSAAQIVLMDSNFSGIVAAMLEGRRILGNLQKSFSYLIAFHIPVVLLALIPPLLGWNALLFPIHIIILELIVHPVSSFTFENLAASGPRAEKSGDLVSRRDVISASLSGLFVSFGALFCYWYLSLSVPEAVARSVAFSAVLIGNIAFITKNIWPQINTRFVVTAFVILLLVAIIAVMPIAALHFSRMGLREIVYAVCAGSLGFLPMLFLIKNTPRGNKDAH